jgi:squalene-hopene/tetraprenyl-beta-curcumene cyclase
MLDDPIPESQNAAQNGIRWLIEATESDLITEPWPIGFYFAKLWYFEKLYPLIFATSTLNRALRLEEDTGSSKT